MSRRNEQLLFRYSSALEHGDFETVAEVLHDAERDSALEQMILDVNAAYTAEPSLNHKNPKEVPMIAALYQKPSRTPVRIQWQSLPLVAALAVIGLLVAMLAVQTRNANFSNLGDTGQKGTPLAVVQNNSICQATTLAPVNVVTLPGIAGVITGTIPTGEVVTVLERRAFTDSTIWYFVTTPKMQGWITIELLDTKNCRETAPPTGASTPTPIPNSSAQPSPYPTALAQSEITCAASTLMKVDLLSVPSLHPNIIGALPIDTLVRVLDYNVWVDSQKNQILWYYVKSDNLQGWTLSYQLDASSCPPIPDLHIAIASADEQVQTATSEAATQYASFFATATYVLGEATRRAESPTFTPTPASINSGDTVAFPPPSVVERAALCTTTLRSDTDVFSLPSADGVILGSLTANTPVAVMDTQVYTDAQQNSVLWYFIAAKDVQGWVSTTTLDAPGCPQTQAVSTFTPTPAPFVATIVPPVNDTAGTAQHPFLIAPTFDPIEMTAIVATLNATFQPIMIPVQNSGQSAEACSTPIPGEPQHMTIYLQPDSNSEVVTEFFTVDGTQNQSHISVLQATYVAGQTWYYIEIGTYPNQPRGFVSKDQFDAVMGSCNITYVQPVGLATPTLIPADEQALSTFTPTPVPFASNAIPQATLSCNSSIGAHALPFTLYAQPGYDAPVVSETSGLLDPHWITWLQTAVHAQSIWYQVQYTASGIATPQIGWVTEDQFNTKVLCALISRGEQATLPPPPVADATPSANQQQSDVPAVKCPTPASASRVIMYSRPSLDSFSFSQNYEAAQDAFFLLDSTDVNGQPWYFVRIGSTVDAKQGWITWDDYNVIKDCAPFNITTQANAVPSDGTIPLVPTLVPADLPIPVIPSDVPPVASGAGFLLDTCHFDLSNTVALYAEPSNDAQVIDLVHIGTSVEVSMPASLWYWVTVRYPDGMGNTGFVRADALTLPDDCHLTPPGTVSVIPATVIPADVAPVPNLSVAATPAVPTVASVTAAPIFTHYVVQPGDTLLYILSRFNLDSSALPKVLFINDLSQIPTLSVGMTLLIPTPTNAQPLTCIVNTRQTLELRASPSADAPVLMTLPTGAVFQIGDRTQESGETWYSVTAQINQVTISNVWLQSGAPLDCRRFAPDSSASVAPVDAATGALQPTPTLVR